MYKYIRITRITISLIALVVPTFAMIVGYQSIFIRMQIIPALFAGTATWILLWAIVTFIYGRIYCSTVCPLGTFQDCVGVFNRLFKRNKSGFRYSAPASRTRLAFLILAVILMLSGFSILPTLLDPYSAYARIINEFFILPLKGYEDGAKFCIASFSTAALTSIAIIAIAGRRGRIICNSACPLGTTLGIASRYSLLHADINTDKCINCGECEKVCKSQCINLKDHTIDTTRCVVCFNCMAVCPNDAVTYRSGNHRLTMTLMQPVPPTPEAKIQKSAKSISK